MVPIHDTDVSEERWSQAEWENYELWEKVELRIKRHRRLWIVTTGILFLGLSAVPLGIDKFPKWTTRRIARKLAQELNQVKLDSIAAKGAIRIRFTGESNLNYIVEKPADCTSTSGEVVRTGSLTSKDGYRLVSPETGVELGVPGLVKDFCYDYLKGSWNLSEQSTEAVIGLGIIPVNDLSDKRMDRMTVLLLSGPSAEISFD